MSRSIPTVSRISTGLTSTLSEGASADTTASWLVVKLWAVSRRTATRVTPGAISLSSSSHLADTVFEIHETGGITARPRQTGDVAGTDWIKNDREHNGRGAGRL